MRAHPVGVLLELALGWQSPPALGLYDNEMGGCLDLEISAAKVVSGFHPYRCCCSFARTDQAFEQCVEEARATGQREPKSCGEVVLLSPQEIKHGHDRPAVPG